MNNLFITFYIAFVTVLTCFHLRGTMIKNVDSKLSGIKRTLNDTSNSSDSKRIKSSHVLEETKQYSDQFQMLFPPSPDSSTEPLWYETNDHCDVETYDQKFFKTNLFTRHYQEHLRESETYPFRNSDSKMFMNPINTIPLLISDTPEKTPSSILLLNSMIKQKAEKTLISKQSSIFVEMISRNNLFECTIINYFHPMEFRNIELINKFFYFVLKKFWHSSNSFQNSINWSALNLPQTINFSTYAIKKYDAIITYIINDIVICFTSPDQTNEGMKDMASVLWSKYSHILKLIPCLEYCVANLFKKHLHGNFLNFMNGTQNGFGHNRDIHKMIFHKIGTHSLKDIRSMNDLEYRTYVMLYLIIQASSNKKKDRNPSKKHIFSELTNQMIEQGFTFVPRLLFRIDQELFSHGNYEKKAIACVKKRDYMCLSEILLGMTDIEIESFEQRNPEMDLHKLHVCMTNVKKKWFIKFIIFIIFSYSIRIFSL